MSPNSPDGRDSIRHGVSIDSTPAVANTCVAGETIQFNVSFDQPVEVEDETMLGTSIGAYCAEGTPRTATYQSGSGAKALVFAYAVKVCDLGTDGVSVGDGNDNNGITGGSITARDTRTWILTSRSLGCMTTRITWWMVMPGRRSSCQCLVQT